MKPLHRCLKILIPCAVALPAVCLALVPEDPDHAALDSLIAALPAPSADLIWVKVRDAISVEELSGSLKLAEERLAKLNDVDEDHRFVRGDWLVVPSQQTRQIKQLAAIDTSELRRSPPLQALPPVQEGAAVRFGDTLVKIAQRYGLSLQDLLRLNPGLETARLVVGSQVRLAQSAPGRTRMVLGLKPTSSGGVSWPELPRFDGPNTLFDGPVSTQGWIWPTKGVFSSGFGWRWGRMHKGIDVANNVGTPIVAAKAGRVVFSGWHDGGYGYLVTLAHADGSRSLYGHNSRLMVQVGQDVEQGSLISQMGSTGRSTGPHLHFEIHPPSAGAANPLQFLPPRA
jgi:LysM repeat protein